MKKQILFLALLTLAIFTGTSSAFGQLLPGITNPANTTPLPIPAISCETNATALNPVPGVPFTYAMNNATGATSLNWTWWATQDINFISSQGNINIANMLKSPSTATPGTDLVMTSASPTYGVDNSTGVAGGANSVQITWSAAILAKTKYQATAADNTAGKFSTFVVGYSEGAAGCTDNLQVFEIKPAPNFTIAIAPIDIKTGVTVPTWNDNATLFQCVDQVQSAKYNIGAGDITMDYGKDSIYFEVAAKNFVTDFAPSFMIKSGLNSDQTATISIYKSYSDASTVGSTPLWTNAATPIDATGMNTLIKTNFSLNATNDADIATGVSFYVKVVIDNNTEESLADNLFTLAVDAYDNTLAGVEQPTISVWDMEDEDCSGTPDTDDDQVDIAGVTITPRPTMIMSPSTDTPGTTNEPSGNAPDDVINKLP